MSLAAGIIGGISSIGGAAISSNAAGKAATTQAGAAKEAAELQAEQAQQAAQLQAEEYDNSQQLGAPFIQGGESALANLENLLGITPSTNATTPVYQPNPLQVPSITFPGTNSPILPTASSNPAAQPAPGSSGLPQGYSAAVSPAQQGAPGTPQSNVRLDGTFGFNRQAAVTPTSPVRGGTSSIASGAPPVPASGQTNNSGGMQTLASLVDPSLGATGSLMQPWTQQFQAPTAAQAEQYPGYQFQLQQGEKAIQNSAAAQGGLFSGNTGEALEQYGQGLAQSDYGNVYNQALGEYQQNYNIFQNNQANQFNRLASLLGMGQTSASNLSSAGLSTGNNLANTLLTSGQQIGQNINNAAAATASGYVGSGNAYGGALGNIANSAGGLLSLQQLLSAQNNAYQASPQAVLDYNT